VDRNIVLGIKKKCVYNGFGAQRKSPSNVYIIIEYDKIIFKTGNTGMSKYHDVVIQTDKYWWS
jgi:hypothetical protein